MTPENQKGSAPIAPKFYESTWIHDPVLNQVVLVAAILVDLRTISERLPVFDTSLAITCAATFVYLSGVVIDRYSTRRLLTIIDEHDLSNSYQERSPHYDKDGTSTNLDVTQGIFTALAPMFPISASILGARHWLAATSNLRKIDRINSTETA